MAGQLPVLSGGETRRAFEKDGWVINWETVIGNRKEGRGLKLPHPFIIVEESEHNWRRSGTMAIETPETGWLDFFPEHKLFHLIPPQLSLPRLGAVSS